MLTAYLDHRGYAVSTAADGLEALDQIAATSPDLIILDLMLPVMSGIQLTKQLAGSVASSRIPIIVVTAMDEYPAGISHAVGFMKKPLDLHRLIHLIRYYLGEQAS